MKKESFQGSTKSQGLNISQTISYKDLYLESLQFMKAIIR